jgi:hypothetical protein
VHTRRTLSLAAFVSLALVTGCSGAGDDDETTPAKPATPGLVVITTDEDSCEYAGPRAVGDGRLTVEFVRKGDSDGSVELLRLSNGVDFDDFAAHIEQEQERLERGFQTLGYARFASLEVTAPLEGSDEQRVVTPQPGDLEPGTHAFLCIRAPALDLVGPLELTP